MTESHLDLHKDLGALWRRRFFASALLVLLVALGISGSRSSQSTSSYGTISQSTSSYQTISQSTSSYRTIRYESPLWYGAAITDLAFEPYGTSTFKEQFDLMSRATAVRIYLNYWAWRHDPTDNSLGLPYKRFLDEVADWCYVRGIKVVWSAHVFSRWGGNWDFDAKRTFLLTGQIDMPNINNASENWTGGWEASCALYWADYIHWVTEIVSRPKLQRAMGALDIFNEPPWAVDWETRGPFQQKLEDRYIEFVRQSIDAVRNVVPNSRIVVEGIPFWYPGFFLIKSLNRTNIIYALHWYSSCDDPYANNWPQTLVARAYAEGRHVEGKQSIIQYLYRQFVGFFTLQDSGYPVFFSEVGTDSYKQETYWSKWMQDFYDICKERRIGFIQHGFFYTPPPPYPHPDKPHWYLFGMLNSDLRGLNAVGRLWHDNLPS